MTGTMIKERTVDQVFNVELAEAAQKSNLCGTAWLVVLGLVFGATLFFTTVLLAWPIVAQYAAKFN